MSHEIKKICINSDNGRLTDPQGALLTDVPRLIYASQPEWQFLIFRSVSGQMSPLDLSDATGWRFAADTDLDSSTEPIMRTNDQNIDHSGAASGLIKVPLDSFTSGFLRVVDKKDSVPIWCELRGMDGQGYTRYAYRFRANALGSVDPVGGPAPQVTSGLAEKTYVDARVNAVSGALDDHVGDSAVHVTASEKSDWNAKSDFSGSYLDLTDKPDLSLYATQSDLQVVSSAVTGKFQLPAGGTSGEFLMYNGSGAQWSAVQGGGQDYSQEIQELSSALTGKIDYPAGGVSGMFLMRTEDGQEWATPQTGGGGGSYDGQIAALQAQIDALSALLSGFSQELMTFTISGSTTERVMLTSGAVQE